MTYATTSDVEVSLGRSLLDDEAVRAPALLARAEARITRRITDLAERIAAETNLRETVIEVESDAVARVLRNPEGLLQEQDGDYLYIRDRNLNTSNELTITADEWTRLGVTADAFTITPHSAADGERLWSAPDAWVDV